MTIAQATGPLVLFLLMFLVGLDLTVSDFRRVASAPRAVVVGTLAQVFLLPLMTFALVTGLGLPPMFGAGAVLLALSPGAGMSNVLVAFAKANTALSVTLTAVASVVAVVTLPSVSAATLQLFSSETVRVVVPVGPLMLQLALSLLLPLVLGMAVFARWPEFVTRYAKTLRISLMALIGVVVAAAIALSDQEQPDVSIEQVPMMLVGAALWTLASMSIGLGVAHLLRLSSSDRFTFMIEFSARNVAVATIVAISGLENLELSLFSGAYMTVGYPMCAVAVVIRRRSLARVGQPAVTDGSERADERVVAGEDPGASA